MAVKETDTLEDLIRASRIRALHRQKEAIKKQLEEAQAMICWASNNLELVKESLEETETTLGGQ